MPTGFLFPPAHLTVTSTTENALYPPLPPQVRIHIIHCPRHLAFPSLRNQVTNISHSSLTTAFPTMPMIPATAATAATAAVPGHSFKLITTSLFPRPLLRLATTAASTSASVSAFEDPPPPQQRAGSSSYFPKKNQTLELECESLAYKGKGICKVSGTGFVVLCDRALPGERFVGRVTRKKGNYAEVTKLRTLSPHRDMVDAPCEYASYCGGCKTQNLLYEAQVRAKEQQVRELLIHVGKFPINDSEFSTLMKPIVPCDIQFHYRNNVGGGYCF